MVDNITLAIEGVIYEGWTQATIHKSLMALSGTFQISMADRQDGIDWNFATQKFCRISIGKDLILSGLIDSVEISIDAESHIVTIAGRELTADLIDCSVVKDRNANVHSGTILKGDILAIARNLLAPFDMKATLGPGVVAGDKFSRFAILKGETVFEALDRAAKQRGLIMTTNEKGFVVFSVSGETNAVDNLKYGANVKSASANYNFTNRYSHYRVEAQSDSGADHKSWRLSANVTGVQKDEGVNRFRPLIIEAEANATPLSCKQRAKLEALYRAANSESYNVDVVGFRQLDKSLWRLNQIVNIDIPPLFIKSNMLISEIVYSLSDAGSITTMTTMRKDAFNDARSLEEISDKIHEQKGAPLPKFNVSK